MCFAHVLGPVVILPCLVPHLSRVAPFTRAHKQPPAADVKVPNRMRREVEVLQRLINASVLALKLSEEAASSSGGAGDSDDASLDASLRQQQQQQQQPHGRGGPYSGGGSADAPQLFSSADLNMSHSHSASDSSSAPHTPSSASSGHPAYSSSLTVSIPAAATPSSSFATSSASSSTVGTPSAYLPQMSPYSSADSFNAYAAQVAGSQTGQSNQLAFGAPTVDLYAQQLQQLQQRQQQSYQSYQQQQHDPHTHQQPHASQFQYDASGQLMPAAAAATAEAAPRSVEALIAQRKAQLKELDQQLIGQLQAQGRVQQQGSTPQPPQRR